jgi:hypothetical protein
MALHQQQDDFEEEDDLSMEIDEKALHTSNLLQKLKLHSSLRDCI